MFKLFKSLKVVFVCKQTVILGVVAVLVCIAAMLVVSKTVPAASTTSADEYVILAANDLGMHCIQKDYSSFLVLPPANNLRVQVFKKGGSNGATLIKSGITIKYKIIDNTTSSSKVNFWQYAKDYGFDVAENVGITGNKLSGEMQLSSDKKYYEATAIPVVPYNDSAPDKLNPYQVAQITVWDNKTNKPVAISDSVVVPVSDEMKCSACHGENDTDLSILKSHDELSGTTLVQDLQNNIRHKCADCHKDNALGVPGKEGVKPLSEAIHGFHQSKMELTDIQPKCNSCHPGPVTQCNRGRMVEAGITCDNPNCHGTMGNVADSQKNGREAWLQEPDCGKCHREEYASNPNTLYKNSYLQNAPGDEMNDKIRCQSCHNSTHAEWRSTLAIDNYLPQSLLGYASFIDKCTVCHEGEGNVHNKPEEIRK
ncbi:MAG TPA: hypothetical protein VIK78_14865 [Ruminiclostridium sp.]